MVSWRECHPVFKLRCIWFKFWVTQRNHLGYYVLYFGRSHHCFCETCCLHFQDMRRLRQQVPIKWMYLSTGLNRVTICMPVLIASLSGLHCRSWCKSQICVLQFLFHKSECMSTHTCRNAHTLFPIYTQKQISFSHKWYVLKIKKVHTPVEYTFGHVMCYLCISFVIN